jgi:type IV secretory pathway VirB10-like protein
MTIDQYGIQVPALPRFMRRLEVNCIARGGGGGKSFSQTLSENPPRDPKGGPVHPAAMKQWQDDLQQARTAEQQQMLKMAENKKRKDEAAAAKLEAERQRVAAENQRMAAEQATYAQAGEASAQSAVAPAGTMPGGTSAEAQRQMARQRRRGQRTSILAGETGLAGNSTLG